MNDEDSTITLTIREYMDYGLTVFDRESKKVGTVHDYDHATGYMQVQPYPFMERFLSIPYRDITHIDPREMFIARTISEVGREYVDPPPRATVVEKRTDPDTGEDDSRAITTEPSGYDGTPVTVEVARYAELAHHFAPGFHVYTSEMEHLGAIRQYDREQGRMVVKSGGLSKQMWTIPVALVDGVDREARNVYLAVSLADLERHPHVGTIGPAEGELTVEAEIFEP